LDLLPVEPTTTRDFSRADQAAVFLRVYSGASKQPATVPMHVEIRDTQDTVVFSRDGALTLTGGRDFRSADYRLVLPLDHLASDDYVLLLRAKALSGSDLQQAVRFRVR
jgi:hypothetical protein